MEALSVIVPECVFVWWVPCFRLHDLLFVVSSVYRLCRGEPVSLFVVVCLCVSVCRRWSDGKQRRKGWYSYARLSLPGWRAMWVILSPPSYSPTSPAYSPPLHLC